MWKGRVTVDNDKEYFWQYKDLEKRIEKILKDYRKTVDYYYSDVNVSNPEYFPIYHSAKVNYVELSNNPSWSGIAFYLGPNNDSNNDSIVKLSLPKNYVQTHTNVSDNELGQLVAKHFNIKELYKDPILMPKINVLAFTNDSSLGESFASEDAERWVKDSKTKIAFHDNKHQNIPIPSSIKAYRSLTESISNDEFVSEINEAYSCYRNKELLACSLVLTRALECISILLLNSKDPAIYLNMKPSQQTLSGIGNALFKHQLINSYELNKLKASINYRNSVNHQTKITEIRQVINHIFDGIRLIADKILNSSNK